MIDIPKLRAALADYNSARRIHEWNRIGRTLTDSVGPLLDLLEAHERVAEAAREYCGGGVALMGVREALANLDASRVATPPPPT